MKSCLSYEQMNNFFLFLCDNRWKSIKKTSIIKECKVQNNKLNDERYVLNKKENEQRHVIKEVYPDSIAEELGLKSGMCSLQSTIRRYRMSLTTDI